MQHLSHGLQHAFQPGTTGIGIVWSDLGAMAIGMGIWVTVALWRFSWLPKAASASRDNDASAQGDQTVSPFRDVVRLDGTTEVKAPPAAGL